MTAQEKHDLICYRLTKSRETFAEVSFLLENSYFNTAVNRLYYACYYAVSALLISKNLAPSTHAGVRQLFGLHFVKTGIVPADISRFYSEIFNLRQTGDYDDFMEFDLEQVTSLVAPADEFIATIEKVLMAGIGVG